MCKIAVRHELLPFAVILCNHEAAQDATNKGKLLVDAAVLALPSLYVNLQAIKTLASCSPYCCRLQMMCQVRPVMLALGGKKSITMSPW